MGLSVDMNYFVLAETILVLVLLGLLFPNTLTGAFPTTEDYNSTL